MCLGRSNEPPFAESQIKAALGKRFVFAESQGSALGKEVYLPRAGARALGKLPFFCFYLPNFFSDYLTLTVTTCQIMD